MSPPQKAKPSPKPSPAAVAGSASPLTPSDHLPLLYAENDFDSADASPLVTPSEADMARHLSAQLLEAEAERVTNGTATLPLSAERTAQFAALDEATRATGRPRDFEETTLMLVRTEARPNLAPHGAMPVDDIAAELAAARAQQAASGLPTASGVSTQVGGPQLHTDSAGLVPSRADQPGPTSHQNADTPRRVGRYRVHKRLGRGGMGTVYRAHDPQLGRDVAIKFLHASMCEDSDARECFLREARAAGGLSHPNIVAVLDVGEIEHRPYIAMELVEGMPLAALLEQRGQLPIRDVVLMGVQLAQALEFAHSNGVVHRDIKPGNIMLLSDGQTIKVNDFGVADIAEPLGERRAGSSTTGPVLGTPQYMSPEQTRGEWVDGRSDLFSTGVVLYQMLAGERPFRAQNMVALATRIATEEPPPLLRKRPDVPASLRRVVDRCLAKSLGQRWQSGQELADALLRVLAELEQAQLQQRRARPVSLALKWAAAMGLLTALVTGSGAYVVSQMWQSAALVRAGEQGAALAQMLAAQHATQVLTEDWDSLAPQLQAAVQSGQVHSVLVADMGGIVRASSNSLRLGQPYAPQGPAAGSLSTAVSQGRDLGDGLMGVETAVVLQGKTIGTLALVLQQRPWIDLAGLAPRLLAWLVLAATLAVAVGAYLAARSLTRPVRQLARAMDEIGRGRLDVRMVQVRNDELGQALASFDAMADVLQRQSAATEGGKREGL